MLIYSKRHSPTLWKIQITQINRITIKARVIKILQRLNKEIIRPYHTIIIPGLGSLNSWCSLLIMAVAQVLIIYRNTKKEETGYKNENIRVLRRERWVEIDYCI